MFDLITINLNKRLSLISLIFIFISIILIFFLLLYNASFDITYFELLNNKDLLKQNYILDSLQTIEIIGVFFVIFLVALELFYNINNFDVYFISLTNKKDYLISKVISYLIIIYIYFLIIFLMFISVYLFRFNELSNILNMLKIMIDYIVYFTFIFLVSYVILLLFHNYFSSILLFIFYWITKIIEEDNFIKKYIFLDIKINIETLEVSFSFEKFYLMIFLVTLVLLCLFIYKKNDLKINS